MTTATATRPTQTRQRSRINIPATYVLGLSVTLLIVLGVIIVADSSYAMAMSSKSEHVRHSPYYFAIKHLNWMIIGCIFLACGMAIGHKNVRKLAFPMVVLTIIGLILTTHHATSEAVQDSRRWISILGFHAQPSELAKFAVAVFTASVLARTDCKLKTNSLGLKITSAFALLVAAVVAKEPDLGTAIIITSTYFCILLSAEPTQKQVTRLLTILLIAGLIFVGVKDGQKQRVLTWLKQGVGTTADCYQTYHGRLGLGAGMVIGRGPGAGKEKHYLPEANSDFVFATVGEEFGFVGTSVVILLFSCVTWAGLKIAKQAKDPYSRYLAMGITCWITIQALINMLVVTMTVPATGVPLPFISYGGSALVMSMTGFGVLLSIGANTQPPSRPRIRVERPSV